MSTTTTKVIRPSKYGIGGRSVQEASDEQLAREYLDLVRSSFDRMFGQHARRDIPAVVDELHARGYTHIANIFGPMEVSK